MSKKRPESPEPRRERRALAQQAAAKTKVVAQGEVADLLDGALTVSADDDGRTLTHGFHAWPARMHPTTARRLVAACPQEGHVFDPFMGSGTVMVEALVGGRRVVGRDINPVAREVAWARTRVWDEALRARLLREAESAVQRARKLRDAQPRVPEPVWESEGAWYDPPALHEVWSLAVSLRDSGGPSATRRALRACLSSIIVKASKQASDSVPVADRGHRFVPPKRVEGWFMARAREYAQQLAEVAAVAPAEHEPDLGILDARFGPRGFERTVQTIITSPPYPGVYDYVAHHQRRYGALDVDAIKAERYEIGARRSAKTKGWRDAARHFEGDMSTVFKTWHGLLVPGGRAYVVIGDGQHPTGVVRVLPMLEAAAAAGGMKLLGHASQERATWAVGGQAGKGKRREYLLALERA